MKNSEYTLGECLNKCGLRSLPDALTNSEQARWINAIVLVSKGGVEEYCIAKNDGNGKPSITHDFGVCRAITFIKNIYPIERLSDNDIIPRFKNDAEIVQYLCKSKYDRSEIELLLSVDGKSPEQIEADRSEINRRINDLALGAQKRKIAERKRVNEIKEFAESNQSQKKTKSNGRRKKKND